MSIDFTDVKAVNIPEGSVKKITRKSDGVVLWEKSLFPAKDTLENTSWADIQTVSKAGLASEYWSVGDQKTIYVNGVAYLVDIIGFDHDTPTNTSTYGRSKAGITFQLHDLLATKYPMNNSSDDLTNWRLSSMRTSTMSMLFSQLNNDLNTIIVPVDKITYIGAGYGGMTAEVKIEPTSDKLFLLAEGEIWDTNNISHSAEFSSLTQYNYYKNGGSRVKYISGSRSDWWLRSPRPSITNACCSVSASGQKNGGTQLNTPRGVSFGFCV